MQIFYHVRDISLYAFSFSWSIMNVFFEIFSDDHTRVVLTEIDGEPDSVYINANYVDVSYNSFNSQ
jgi:protein tyrosine phosphatase